VRVIVVASDGGRPSTTVNDGGRESTAVTAMDTTAAATTVARFKLTISQSLMEYVEQRFR